MASRYWVIGGEYVDTTFTIVADGTTEERIGPFATYEEARNAWQGRAWATVDSCSRRYRIVEEALAPSPKRFWVVGGDYLDTGFRDLAPGTSEERIGPFETYEKAHEAWQAKAWSTVDSCTRRYRIVEETPA